MQARDRDVVARDWALPGLGTVLEPATLLAELQTAWPRHELSDPQLTYLRYKPETNCLAAYALLVDGERTFVHATAHRLGDEAKLYNAPEKFGGESALEPAVLPQRIVARAFPTDRKLGALKRLTDPAARWKLLRATLPEHPELWAAGLEVLRYKPERRLVARLRAPDGSRALLKLYHDDDFKRARAGAKAFSWRRPEGQLMSVPLLGLHRSHRLLVWRWLEASACDTVLGERPALAEDMGRALATLHAQPPAALMPVTRAKEGRPLRAAAESVAYLLPELASRVRRLAASLEDQLLAAPPLRVPVHGDFSADQVLETPEGVAIIDFDAAALGDPAWDLGTFTAQLERGVLRENLTAEAVSAVQAALQAGYRGQSGTLPPRIALYTAVGLLRLAPHAFRTRRERWPEEMLALLEKAEELAEVKSVPTSRSAQPSGTAQLEADPGLQFATGALEPTTISAHLSELFGPHELRRAELLRHKAGRRALIGYTLRRHEGTVSLLGKVRAKGTDTKTHALQTFLWRHGFNDTGADGVSVAEPLGTLEPFHMTLQRAVPGISLETLLSPDAEPLMRRVAEAAYKLHRTPAPLSRRHTAHDELVILRRQLDAVSAAQPQYEKRLELIVLACEALAGGLDNALLDARPATLHRDFYPEQLLVDGNRLYLLDLDLCALGDPELDIGNFVAHLREYALRVLGDAAALSSLEGTLTEHYCTLARVSPQRVDAYATLSLARHIAISQRLPARRQLTGALLTLSEMRLGLLAR
jgi:aminoglycoside phosphotransferase (APT) family kinase protein